jgi:murein L,D-transpeptidase YcbB/YkuD
LPRKRGNVLSSPTAWQGKRRSLTKSVIALALSCGLPLLPLCALATASEETNSTATAAAPDSDTAAPDTAPFLGNVELKARLDLPGKLTIAGERLHVALLRGFYTAHGYQTVWDSHPAEASRLWDAVLRSNDHGLDPGLFHSAALGAHGPTLSPIERDLLLSDAFLSYADALSRGAMPIEDRADDEDLTPEPVDIVAALDTAISDPDPARVIEGLAPSSPEYTTLRRAYADYRSIAQAGGRVRNPGARNRLDPTPVTAEKRARQLAINLERLRWLPRRMPPDRVMVNAAIARLQLFRSDRPVFTTRVVVGEIDKQTPEFQSAINDVLFNPPWNIPRSIAQTEILPKLAADSDYLKSHHMRVRSNGSIQQEAGPYSALGRLKFEMTDRYDVYLHDTPTKSLFQSVARMMSHGCVRVESPRALAVLLLGQTPEAIDRGIASGHTSRRLLPAPMPAFIVYQTAYVESDGSIQFRSDPYDRDNEIWQRLTRSPQLPVAQDSAISQRKG